MEIHPLDAARCAGAEDLFASNPSSRGCWCQHTMLTKQAVADGWGEGNRRRFQEMAADAEPLFAGCGFTVRHRPSAGRVIMRLTFPA